MKYYFRLFQILLIIVGIKDIGAFCWWSKQQNDEDNSNIHDKLALRNCSLSTDSNSSIGRTSEQSELFSSNTHRASFPVFTIYEGNFSQDVVVTTEDILRSQYKFNKKSAACFMWLKNGLMNSFDYENPLEKTKNVRRHALRFLNECDFFPKDYSEKARNNLVYALQFFLQKRYSLLNYCMKVVRDEPVATSEFFLIFAEKSFITQKFPECLANYFLQNPATQTLPDLEKIFLRQSVWATIIAAFSSYHTRGRNYLDYFWV